VGRFPVQRGFSSRPKDPKARTAKTSQVVQNETSPAISGKATSARIKLATLAIGTRIGTGDPPIVCTWPSRV